MHSSQDAGGDGEAGRRVAGGPVPGLRDVGGHATVDGRRVRTGVVFRSAGFARLAPDEREAFAGLGVRTVFDLRTFDERRTEPNPHLPGVEQIVVDVLGGRDELVVEPTVDSYREIVGLATARAAYRRLFVDLARPRHRPAVVHCTTGKDRAGWAAAAILLFVGVSEEDVMRDYLRGGGRPPDHLDAALDEMRRRYETIDGYVTVGLGVPPAEQRAVREALLAPA